MHNVKDSFDFFTSDYAFVFLNVDYKNSTAAFPTPEILYACSLVFVVVTLLLVGVTFYTLNKKKQKFNFNNNIRLGVEQWISEVISDPAARSVAVPENFMVLFKKPEARQMMIEELVRNKSSFLGIVSDNIIQLYYQLGLNVDSRIKLDDKQTHIQCQGIHELCVMEQKDQYGKIYHLTNSKNSDVRLEAQTAVIQLYGFTGLRFLDVVSYPITEFQQLKLLEMLRQLPFTGLPTLDSWLQSKNDTVISFALKLAQHYKQVQVHNEAAVCLQHKNEAVRVQAVKTLAQIANNTTANLLTEAYQNERFTNRLNILRELPKIASDAQRDFLIVQLHEGHEFLKLAAAKVLAKCTSEGMEILEAKGQEDPIPYKQIYLHVKAERER